MSQRSLLPKGYTLKSKNRTYTIDGYVGAGSNSVVYRAFYYDTFMPDRRHIVLLKELYPFDEKRNIRRDENWSLIVDPEDRNFFNYHKSSFISGNAAHLTLSEAESEHIAENLDSFEENNTIYTVLTAKKGQVLSELFAGGKKFPTFTDTILFIGNLLRALIPFHSHQLLHLDISPDNIFLLAPEQEETFPVRVLLLDFNSAYSMKEGEIFENQYYFGKTGYMAPEVLLHKKEEIGPWTDLYSVSVLWYEILSGETFPEDRELMNLDHLVSPYDPLLLHEKERSAAEVNRILKKGLQFLPANRYRSVEEMLQDVKKLHDIVTGVIREPLIQEPKAPAAKKSAKKRILPGILLAAVFLGGGVGGALLMRGIPSEGSSKEEQSMEHTKLDLTSFPLETDDSVVLTEKNIRHPLVDNIMEIPVQSSMSARINLKDYTHPRDTTEVFETYGIFSIYNGEGDKRGWQFADLTYDFFYTEDNTMHMELPFQDTNDFNLEYIGVIFQNHNHTETNVLLDIKDCTLIDGEGNHYDITELEGSHVLYFDEENWQWNLMTTQNQEFVKDFDDIYGGKLVVDAEVGFLDPLLEIQWESDNPDVATVDEKGRIFANRQGQATITVTIKDKHTDEVRKTQMLIHVRSKLG